MVSADWSEFTESLARAARRARSLETDIAFSVSAARAAGVPWSVIGQALGVSKQAAQQRYGRLTTDRDSRRT